LRPEQPRVLRFDRDLDIVRRQVQAEQLVGIEPHAHGALGREQPRPTDTGQAPDLGQDVARRHVAEADLVEAAVARRERDELEDSAARLGDHDAPLAHLLRQTLLNALDAVLKVDRGKLDVGIRIEVDDDLDLAGGVAGRFVVEDVGGAVELILYDPGDAEIEVLRRGAGVARRDRHRGRRDRGILVDREQRQREQAADADQDRHHPGEDRPRDEKAGHGAAGLPTAVFVSVDSTLAVIARLDRAIQ
jgi:hypothetical protein